METLKTIFFIWILMTAMLLDLGSPFLALADPIIADHTTTDITAIPQAAIEAAKTNLHIAYGHTSHGSQITSGMDGLVGFANNGGKGLSLPVNIFQWNNGGTAGALDIEEGDGYGSGWMDHDAGYYPNWINETREYLDDSSHSDVNVIIWSWCGQASGYTEQQMIDQYLAPMTQLEAEYPHVTFVYMTGHADGGGETGNLHLRNQQIRNYCAANDKVLFDFYDIEIYDPDGNYFGDKGVEDDCDYDGGNWAIEWQNSHSEGVDWYNCSSAHSQPLNANLKAYAAWWLFARLAGWQECTAAPSDFTATINDTNPYDVSVDLTWTDNSMEEDYYVVQRREGTHPWSTRVQLGPNAESYTDGSLAPGTYEYRALAHRETGDNTPCDASSQILTVTVVSNTIPNAPSSLIAVLDGFDLTLTWQDNSDNEEGFTIYQEIEGSGFFTLAVTGPDMNTFVVRDLAPYNEYSFLVTAYNGNGESQDSNTTAVYLAADTFTIRLEAPDSEIVDSFLQEGSSANTNFGNEDYLSSFNRFILKFNLPESVMGKQIISAGLGFYVWNASAAVGNQFSLYEVTREWTENGVTWNESQEGVAWSSQGGDLGDAVGLLSIPVYLDHAYTDEVQIKDIVQEWTDQTKPNYGILLDSGTLVSFGIKASEYRPGPYLEITYSSKPVCITDANGDGDVDGQDLSAFARNFSAGCLNEMAKAFGQ